MHMADALLAPAVAATMYAASAVTAGASVKKIVKEDTTEKLPTMAIMSSLVFAGQMINYTIPGTGSSGHLCGGMMLTALLGPQAGFLSMIVILAIQCLFFADGGLMALGANCWNMAFYGCFIGYYLIYKPILQSKLFSGMGEKAAMRCRIIIASILGCVITLQLGAFSVVIETRLSGITELPFGAFCALMQPIHLAIGLVEGLITSAVLVFVYEARPEMLPEVKSAGGLSLRCRNPRLSAQHRPSAHPAGKRPFHSGKCGAQRQPYRTRGSHLRQNPGCRPAESGRRSHSGNPEITKKLTIVSRCDSQCQLFDYRPKNSSDFWIARSQKRHSWQ